MRWSLLALLPLITSLDGTHAATQSQREVPSPDHVVVSFKRIQLTDKFWSDGVAVADINRDGHLDVVSGPFWYEGPDFTRRHEIFPATQSFTRPKGDGTEERVEGYEGALGTHNAYSNVQVAAVRDLNGDGWPDIITIGFPGQEAVWYENPGPLGLTSNAHWARHVIFDEVDDESPTVVDLFKEGQPVVLCMSGGAFGYLQPEANRVRQKWRFHAVSAPLSDVREIQARLRLGNKSWPYVHGLGYGDVNGDGRLDLLGPEGWWEQPPTGLQDTIWKFHPWSFLSKRPQEATSEKSGQDTEAILDRYRWPFALGGAQIHAYDVNGDGRPDIISSLNAHGYGLAWFEQLPRQDPSEEVQFRPHILMGRDPSESRYGLEFTELHAVEVVDVDGDGLKDVVTGKRFWAHGRDGSDPETNAPAVLYWFRLVRRKNGDVDFVPYLIDGESGVGTQFVATDVDGDGLVDIVVANKKGTFVFLQQTAKVSQEAWARAQPKVQFPSVK